MDYRDPDWVADKLGIDKNTVYRFLQDGTLPAIQLGRKWLISEKRLAEWLEAETDRQTHDRRAAAHSASTIIQRMDHFTAPARQALKLAHAQARGYAHEMLDQPHLLLGLLAEGKSAGARALQELGLTIDQVRAWIDQRLKPGEGQVPRRLARTPQAKRAMRIAMKVAERECPGKAGTPALVGTDHLLAGIFFARQGLGHELLTAAGVTRRTLKQALRRAGRDASRRSEPTNDKGASHD